MTGPGPLAPLIAEWRAARAQLAALEAAEHPAITDVEGRVWVWWKGDLYRSGEAAVPRCFVRTDW